MTRRAWLAVSVMAALGLAGCGSSPGAGSPPSSLPPAVEASVPTTSTTLATTTTSRLTDPDPSCTPAAEADVDQIETLLVEPAVRLGDAYTARGPNGFVYVGANIYDAAGERISHQDAWVRDDQVWYALTGSAREYSTWPASRDFLDRMPVTEQPRPGDDTAQGLFSSCVGPAVAPG
jgi:hypothetical protein